MAKRAKKDNTIRILVAHGGKIFPFQIVKEASKKTSALAKRGGGCGGEIWAFFHALLHETKEIMDECLSGKAPKDMVKWGLKIKETTDEDGLVYRIEDE